MIPEEFDGVFKINKSETFRFYEKINSSSDEPFIIHFYRRETEEKSLGEFIDSLLPENIGWDKPSRQLFFKDKKGKTYQLNFKELK